MINLFISNQIFKHQSPFTLSEKNKMTSPIYINISKKPSKSISDTVHFTGKEKVLTKQTLEKLFSTCENNLEHYNSLSTKKFLEIAKELQKQHENIGCSNVILLTKKMIDKEFRPSLKPFKMFFEKMNLSENSIMLWALKDYKCSKQDLIKYKNQLFYEPINDAFKIIDLKNENKKVSELIDPTYVRPVVLSIGKNKKISYFDVAYFSVKL